MSNFKFKETTIPTNYSTQIEDAAGLTVAPENVSYLYDTLITSISDFLGMVKKKENKTSVVIKDLKGNFLLAGIVSYHANEDAEMPGNWSYELSFDEEDTKETTLYLGSDSQYTYVYAKTAYNLHAMEFPNALHVQPLISQTAETLRDWLDINAKEGEEVSVELPGYFIATVVVEKGEKVLSITPDGAMTRLVKDDSALEVEEPAS